MSNTDLPSVQESNAQILNDIQSLQTIEQQLFSNLEENTGLSADQQQKIIQKINDISKMRINLYQTLNGVNSFFQNALVNSKGTLMEQSAAIDIVEQELNVAKRRLKLLEEEKNNKIRIVEINGYYGQKYEEHSSLMKIIVVMLIPILILAILHNKGIIPERFDKIYYFVIVIISFIGAVFIWRTVLSIMTRDSMNYQEYNFAFDPNSAPTSTSVTTTDPWASNKNFGTCVGDACCGDKGLVYDVSMNLCIIPGREETTTTTTTESFVNEVLTKPSYSYKKPDVTLGGESVMPKMSESFKNY
jgi:hypothetical protein